MTTTNLIEQLNNATSREDSHKCKIAAIALEAQAKQIEALKDEVLELCIHLDSIE